MEQDGRTPRDWAIEAGKVEAWEAALDRCGVQDGGEEKDKKGREGTKNKEDDHQRAAVKVDDFAFLIGVKRSKMRALSNWSWRALWDQFSSLQVEKNFLNWDTVAL